MTEWRKSSRSSGFENSDCVEVARLPESIGMRDSKNPGGGHLTLGPERFAALVQQIKHNNLESQQSSRA
jgi:Domain of unknown function (DUF397)